MVRLNNVEVSVHQIAFAFEHFVGRAATECWIAHTVCLCSPIRKGREKHNMIAWLQNAEQPAIFDQKHSRLLLHNKFPEKHMLAPKGSGLNKKNLIASQLPLTKGFSIR